MRGKSRRSPWFSLLVALVLKIAPHVIPQLGPKLAPQDPSLADPVSGELDGLSLIYAFEFKRAVIPRDPRQGLGLSSKSSR